MVAQNGDVLDAPLPDGYRPKQPFWTRQQRECFVKLLPLSRSFLIMEPRTGKSAPIVAKTCFYFERKSHPLHVAGLLIIAFPNGVHRGWITEAFPENAPDRIRWSGMIWRADKCRQVGFRRELEALNKFSGLSVLSINVESVGSDETRKAIGAFLKARGRVFVVFDESSALVESGSLRARIMANIGKLFGRYVTMMANLDGTPVDKAGPLDYYSQVGWMGHDIIGYPNKVEFNRHFAEIVNKGRGPYWSKVRAIRERRTKELEKLHPEGMTATQRKEIQEASEREAKHGTVEENGTKRRIKPGRDFWTEVAKDAQTGLPKYRNMDEIWAKLDPISYRATFAECFPDSTRKVYQKRYFQLSDKQRAVYDALQKEHAARLEDGTEIKGEHPLTRQLRAQQVTSNYYPEQKRLRLHGPCSGEGCEACADTGVVEFVEPMKVIDADNNPRLDALALELKLGQPAVVWCRFRQDVDACIGLAERLGCAPCRYDGAAGYDQKADAREGFQSGKYGVIVGNEQSLSRGIPLWRSSLMVAYSNMFSYRTRMQIEDRCEHGSKKIGTSIVDLVAEDTVDDKSIIPALRAGFDVATWVLRDEKRDWI